MLEHLAMVIILVTLYTFSTYSIRKNLKVLSQKKVEFNFDGVVPVGKDGYALVLTNRIISISSDGQRMFDLN